MYFIIILCNDIGEHIEVQQPSKEKGMSFNNRVLLLSK
jgi:hypothetical protein